MAAINYNVESTTLTLNGTVFTDFIKGDNIIVTPLNDFSSHIDGSNGGVGLFKRTDGNVHTVEFRLLRNSDNDIFMNTQINKSDLVVFNGSISQNYTRDGISGVETFIIENGTITTRPTFTYNDEDGNAASEYTMTFRNVVRNI